MHNSKWSYLRNHNGAHPVCKTRNSTASCTYASGGYLKLSWKQTSKDMCERTRTKTTFSYQMNYSRRLGQWLTIGKNPPQLHDQELRGESGSIETWSGKRAAKKAWNSRIIRRLGLGVATIRYFQRKISRSQTNMLRWFISDDRAWKYDGSDNRHGAIQTDQGRHALALCRLLVNKHELMTNYIHSAVRNNDK